MSMFRLYHMDTKSASVKRNLRVSSGSKWYIVVYNPLVHMHYDVCAV